MTVILSNVNIVEARKTGGKAGNGRNKTSTIQVIEIVGNKGYNILKQFRFNLMDESSKQKAKQKAKEYVNSLNLNPHKG